MADQQDIIIIRGGRVQVRRSAVDAEEASILDQIAEKGDQPLSPLEAFALGAILRKVARSP